MDKQWSGIERRKEERDHDTLIQIVQILDNHVQNSKVIADNLKAHEIQDQHNFDGIRKDILALQKVVWTATGILIALDAMPKAIEVVKTISGH